ncbi:PREDICTED: UBN2_2 domain-containing, partial [Prunus dulcis]
YDFVLKEDSPQEPTADASAETKIKFAKWNKANKMAILIMQRAMASSVKGSIPKSDIAKKYYEAIAQRFKESEKAVKSTLLNRLIDMKYYGQGCVRAHILNMIDIGTKLQELQMTVDEDMMVHFALNSLPKEFKSLRETYIAQKECWNLNDLITICVQQEHNIIRERGAKMVNTVQVKEKKE